jgi:hypothetical protein
VLFSFRARATGEAKEMATSKSKNSNNIAAIRFEATL